MDEIPIAYGQQSHTGGIGLVGVAKKVGRAQRDSQRVRPLRAPALRSAISAVGARNAVAPWRTITAPRTAPQLILCPSSVRELTAVIT